jgi:hypothetical protein
MYSPFPTREGGWGVRFSTCFSTGRENCCIHGLYRNATATDDEILGDQIWRYYNAYGS